MLLYTLLVANVYHSQLISHLNWQIVAAENKCIKYKDRLNLFVDTTYDWWNGCDNMHYYQTEHTGRFCDKHHCSNIGGSLRNAYCYPLFVYGVSNKDTFNKYIEKPQSFAYKFPDVKDKFYIFPLKYSYVPGRILEVSLQRYVRDMAIPVSFDKDGVGFRNLYIALDMRGQEGKSLAQKLELDYNTEWGIKTKHHDNEKNTLNRSTLKIDIDCLLYGMKYNNVKGLEINLEKCFSKGVLKNMWNELNDVRDGGSGGCREWTKHPETKASECKVRREIYDLDTQTDIDHARCNYFKDLGDMREKIYGENWVAELSKLAVSIGTSFVPYAGPLLYLAYEKTIEAGQGLDFKLENGATLFELAKSFKKFYD